LGVPILSKKLLNIFQFRINSDIIHNINLKLFFFVISSLYLCVNYNMPI